MFYDLPCPRKIIYTIYTASPSDSALYPHTELSHIKKELREMPILFTGGWRNNFAYD